VQYVGPMTNFRHTTAFLFLTSVSLSGCTLAGDRAASGLCPIGKTCSSEVSGLFFLGAAFSDNIIIGAVDVPPVAVGGTESVTALTGESTDSPPFADGFTADTTDASELSIDAVTPPSVTVHGHDASGAAQLELFQAGTTTVLLDEVTLSVEAISTVTVFPLELVLPADFSSSTTPTPWVLLAGSTAVPLVVQLAGADGTRIVDESATLTSPSGAATRQAWDLFAVTAPAAPGKASFAIQAGGAPFATTASVVQAVDDIQQKILLSSSPGATPQIISSADVCYVGQSAGAPVAGVTWTFTPSSNLTVMSPGLGAPGCLELVGTADGPATLTVTASGLTKTFDFTVSTKGEKSAPHRAAPRRPRAPVAGARAASMVDERDVNER
jgi:hypothetical protein